MHLSIPNQENCMLLGKEGPIACTLSKQAKNYTPLTFRASLLQDSAPEGTSKDCGRQSPEGLVFDKRVHDATLLSPDGKGKESLLLSSLPSG